MKLMSLFDGSGGFPLAASLCGIEPVYAAEVEPYPIAVTKSRFPKMKHLGDVSKVKGGEIEPVDIITFGSPCQDMSIAGKRAGLKHADMGDDETTRSGLFLEAIRIIKEMREATNGVYPRFAVWENVPGAFSSNKGEDFRTVLEEFIRVKEKDAVMPPVPKAGWAYADYISGDGWSLAYRVFDAQHWGVPQRRRRIYLVADFRGECAGKILFEREGVRGYFETGRTQGESVTAYAENGTRADDCKRVANTLDASYYKGCGERQGVEREVVVTLEPGIAAREGGHIYDGCSGTLRANAGDNQMSVAYGIENHSTDSRVKFEKSGKCQTLTSRMGTGGNNVPMVMEQVICLQGNGIDRSETAGCNGKGWKEDTAYTLNTIDRPAVAYGEGGFGEYIENRFSTLKASGGVLGVIQGVVYDGANITSPINKTNPNIGSPCHTLSTDNRNYAVYCGLYPTLQARYIVRRLIPTECARLQGFPDWWCVVNPVENLTDEDYAFWLGVRNTYAKINNKTTKEYSKEQMLSWYNKLHTDSAEYKMWGNGIALPNALYVMQGIATEGGEGGAIRVPEAPYQIGLRNETMLKMKQLGQEGAKK